MIINALMRKRILFGQPLKLQMILTLAAVILIGKCKLADCPLFAKKCNPDNAYGALMVSSPKGYVRPIIITDEIKQ